MARLGQKNLAVPDTLVKAFRIEAEKGGNWESVLRVTDNQQRLVKLDLNVAADAVRLIPGQAWGAEHARIFAWELC